MLHSIRWRLTASFALLTLLTVILLGVTVVTLMKRSLERQVSDYLRANAQALAHQSQALFVPMPHKAQLAQLAQTTAFLSDVQVRILDEERQLLVESGVPGAAEGLTWILRSAGPPVSDQQFDPVDRFDTVVIPAPPAVPAWPPGDAPDESPPAGVITVRRLPSPWGDRLFFQDVVPGVPLADQAVFTGTVATHTIVTSTALALFPAEAAFQPARAAVQVTAPIEAGAQVVGYVELSRPPDFVSATLAVVRRAFLLAAAAVTALSVALGLIVSGGLTAPLAGLAAATARMNSGDLSARAPVRGQDEIGLLARQFNQMAEALEQSFAALAAERDALRRFVADASHELRTPITALRTFFELLLGVAEHDPAAQREFLAESQGQIDRLERITENLLNLSRLEGGLVALQVEEHDLADLVAESAACFRTMAQERQIELRVDPTPEPILLACDGRQLETAISNLLDNALKFTPAGGQVQVGVEATDEEVCLWVKDNGMGIPPEELPYIFERFHRGRRAVAAGSGLGLAIVQSIVHAHGGTIEVTSQPALGSRFTLKLPRKNKQAQPIEMREAPQS
jgi:signal transduction histidine kinase